MRQVDNVAVSGRLECDARGMQYRSRGAGGSHDKRVTNLYKAKKILEPGYIEKETSMHQRTGHDAQDSVRVHLNGG